MVKAEVLDRARNLFVDAVAIVLCVWLGVVSVIGLLGIAGEGSSTTLNPRDIMNYIQYLSHKSTY
jgi:hypothetical protein